jgi:hypothetical protein
MHPRAYSFAWLFSEQYAVVRSEALGRYSVYLRY